MVVVMVVVVRDRSKMDMSVRKVVGLLSSDVGILRYQ